MIESFLPYPIVYQYMDKVEFVFTQEIHHGYTLSASVPLM